MNSRLYVGRLSYRVRERDLEKFFKNYGRINDIMLKNGYAFVEFEDLRDAEDAALELNGRDLCGERVVIELAKGTPHGRDAWKDRERGIEYPKKDARYDDRDRGYDKGIEREKLSKYGHRCVIENISSRATKHDIKDLLKKMGEIGLIEMHSDYVVVEFLSSRDMKYAIEKLYGTDFFGRRIKLFEEKEDKKVSKRKSYSKSPRSSAGRHSKSKSRSCTESPSPKRTKYNSQSPLSRSASKSLDRHENHFDKNGKKSVTNSAEKDVRVGDRSSRSYSRSQSR